MKKILYLSRGGNVGGSQKQLEYLIRNLHQEYQPFVVCSRPGDFVQTLYHGNVETWVTSLRPWRKARNLLSRYLDSGRVVRYAKENRIDLVHCSDIWLSGYLLQITGKLGVPGVIHVRMPLTSREIAKHKLHKASAIIAISKRIKRNLLEAGIKKEKIHLIEDAIDLNLFQQKLPKENILLRDFPHSRGYLIGLVGHIRPFKKQREFLEVAAHFCNAYNMEATFFIVGEVHDSRYMEELRQFILDNNLAERVVFTGNRNDMPSVLNALDVLVSLSGGSVMYEGMASGICVISAGFTTKYDATHLRDGETGLLLDTHDPAGMASSFMAILQNVHLRSALGKQAKAYAERALGCQRMSAATVEIYDALLVSDAYAP